MPSFSIRQNQVIDFNNSHKLIGVIMFIIFLLMSFYISGSEVTRGSGIYGVSNIHSSEPAENDNPMSIITTNASSYGFSSPEEESELCELAVRRLSDSGINLNGHVTPYLRDIVKREVVQSDNVDLSGVQVLRRLKSGDLDDHEFRYVQKLVMSAIKESMDHKDKQIEERWSRLQSVCAMIVTGLVTSAISTLSSVFAEKNKQQ